MTATAYVTNEASYYGGVLTMTAFRFEFQPTVKLTEAEMSLHLAIYAIEGLFGEARVRLETGYELDAANRLLVVNADGEIGASLVQVYTRLLIREFGENAFHVRRVERASVQQSDGALVST